MIKINVDEGYAFDFLSILKVKRNANQDINEPYNDCRNNLICQLGYKVFREIEDSIEYQKLVETNQLIFETIDKLKKEKVSAAYVDSLNYKRFIQKQEIQKKFFNKKQSEVKIGY